MVFPKGLKYSYMIYLILTTTGGPLAFKVFLVFHGYADYHWNVTEFFTGIWELSHSLYGMKFWMLQNVRTSVVTSNLYETTFLTPLFLPAAKQLGLRILWVLLLLFARRLLLGPAGNLIIMSLCKVISTSVYSLKEIKKKFSQMLNKSFFRFALISKLSNSYACLCGW